MDSSKEVAIARPVYIYRRAICVHMVRTQDQKAVDRSMGIQYGMDSTVALTENDCVSIDQKERRALQRSIGDFL